MALILSFNILQGANFPALKKIVDASQVFIHLLMPEFEYFIHQSIKKFPVVGNHNKCTIKGQKSIFQDILGPHIQVIGGLIKDQKIKGLK